MDIDPNIALAAYAKSSNTGAASGGEESSGSGGGVSFSDFLKDKASDAVDSLRTSERLSAQAVTGEADITEVVQAVTAAELTLQTVVSVRDRMVQAYQEILRMPI